MFKDISLQREIFRFSKPFRYKLTNFLNRRHLDLNFLNSLKDVASGSPMLVVGNGPSLNKTPLDSFANCWSIGMNKIDLIFERTEWRPSIIICVNDVVARQHQHSFASQSVPTLLALKTAPLIKSSLREKMEYIQVNSEGDFSKDILRGLGSGSTVTYSALQLAHWMGASPIVIVGVDHSFNFEGASSSYQRMSSVDNNHFHSGYFEKGSMWATPDLPGSEGDYERARLAVEESGSKILDATVDGHLSIFPKISIDAAIKIFAR